MAESKITATKFRTLVWRHYKAHGRHDLPWRKAKNIYNILVSEVMLQQTQVERVIPFYKKFIKEFPTAATLAAAPLYDVLRAWQGLGYNRRAKMLHEAAKPLATTRFDRKSASSRSDLVAELEALPGVGPYTARAVAAFAWNADVVFVETNIRTAIIHHFFNRNEIMHGSISDRQICGILTKLLPKGRARVWYNALMDYGAHLKRSGISHNAQSAHYTKQSRFAGSLREARGAILRTLAADRASAKELVKCVGSGRGAQVKEALQALLREEMIEKAGTFYRLPRQRKSAMRAVATTPAKRIKRPVTRKNVV